MIFRRKHIKVLQQDLPWFSKRYQKWTTPKKGFKYDGATGVMDVDDLDGAMHDWNFYVAYWDDGTPMTFEEANNNYTDWLKENGHWIVCHTRKALYFVGRNAWEQHRRREMIIDNLKFMYMLRDAPHDAG